MLDTLIIGAGPAGLAAARALKHRGLPFTHVERHSGVGGLWDIDNPGTPMYESAHFISSKTLSAFTGYPMPDDYPDYPSHRQILAYLRDFADHYGLTDHVEFGREVVAVERTEAGTYRATTADAGTGKRRTVTEHANVIAASGVQWDPYLPDLPGEFAGEVRHSVTYRDPSEFAGKRVLVVGAGNSGCDIACDAARTADEAAISVRRGYWFIPKHIFGKPVDVFADEGPSMPMWLEQRVFGRLLRVIQGDLRRYGLPQPDHKLFETHPILNDQLLHHLGHGDITARGAIAAVDGHTVTFADGAAQDFDLILMATGYRHTIAYAPDLFTDTPQSDLYLTAFGEHEGLFGLGYLETNSGAYVLISMLADLIASHIDDRPAPDHEGHPRRYEAFRRRIGEDTPDLTHGIDFVDSPRHHGYVDSVAIRDYVAKTAARMSWDLQ